MKNIKRVVLIILLLFSITPTGEIRAGHLQGGEIYYQYIGDSTGINHHYRIFLKLNRNASAIDFGSHFPVSINSSCFPDQTITVQSISPHNRALKNFDECTDSVLIWGHQYDFSLYESDIVLPGVCTDFKFSFSICCRNSNSVNIANGLLYLESGLNNTYGPNSSARILSEGFKGFCLNRLETWPQKAVEPDGDSLFYELAQPLDGPGLPVVWALGYSTSRPILSSSGVTFNSRNGDFVFNPTTSGLHTLRFRVNEWAKDTTTSNWYKKGYIDRDVLMVVLNNCAPNPPVLSASIEGINAQGITELACYTSRIEVQLSGRVDCRSISPDGTDFVIYNSLDELVPIISAGSDSCQGGFTQSLWLQLNTPIHYNDNLNLVTRLGNDVNTLLSSCGVMLEENDSIALATKTCTTSVGQREIQVPSVEIYPNPARDKLNIVSEGLGQLSYTIYNSGGRIVKNGLTTNNTSIDISAFPASLYIIRFSSKEGISILKFQKNLTE